MNTDVPVPLDLGALVARHRGDASRLVQILRDVMAAEGHISPPVITELARALGVPRGHVEGVVGFYSFFAAEPRGRFRVLFSDNITDEMAGSRELREQMLQSFRLEPGEVSRDGLLSIGVTSCTGLCDQGPAMLVNDRAIARLTPQRIGVISSLIRGGSPVDLWPDNLFAIHSHVERRDRLLSTPLAPGEGVDAAIARGAAATLQEITRSGLRGRGGAGFSTGAKWAACAAAPGPDRYIVCNADEGEPGTFKDRELFASHAGLVIEGMTVAGFAVGATKGLIYLRAEYPFLVAPLLSLLDERRRAGLLGEDVRGRGFDFDIELHIGAGAYVCGEESSLLESLEGKRGIPRSRPPYPVTHGYKQKPTVVNNVETLAAAALVARHGADLFLSLGTARSSGTKVLSVSGDVERPGIYEYPYGVSVRQVLEDAGAVDTQAVQVGGPSGTLLSAGEFHRCIAFEDVPSAGAFMVFDGTRDMLAIVENFTRFFAHESCGFCTPCRVGTTLSAQMMKRIVSGRGSRRDVKDLARVSQVMRSSSHCGLGATAGNPVVDALAKFRPSFDRRLRSLNVLPTFDLDEALAPAREATARDDAGAHFEEEGS